MRAPRRGINGEPELMGWPRIAAYLEVSEDTAQRWADAERLPAWASYPIPVRKIMGHPWTLPSQLEVWLDQQDMPHTIDQRLRRRAGVCGREGRAVRKTPAEKV